MATNTSFNDILKRYMPYELLVEEAKKMNYFFNTVEKKKGWKGGTMEVPFEGGEFSSLSMGELTASNDIANATEVMGTISVQPELWGTMSFSEKDLDRHDGDMEASYLELAPGKINQFVKRMTERVSLMMLGGSLARATADGQVGGTIVVDKPNRFTIGEKVTIDDDNSSPVNGYITAIDMNTRTLTVKNARTAGAAVDLSGYTAAQNTQIYVIGSQAAGFTSLKSQLLSATNGGNANLFGQVKTNYPHLQAFNTSGSAFTASNLLEGIFDAYYTHLDIGKGQPSEVLVSMKHFKNIAKILEAKRDFVTSDKKAGYGWSSVSLVSGAGELKITGLRDMQDDYMPIIDWSALKIHGDKFFERKRHDGREYFLERGTTGYNYIVDVKFYGDLVVAAPARCGIIHGISYV